MKKTTTEYRTGIMRIVEERVVIPIGEYQKRLLGLRHHDWEASYPDYVSVNITYHIGGRILLGRFVFQEDTGKQWRLQIPGQSKPLSFPNKSKMDTYVRRHFA